MSEKKEALEHCKDVIDNFAEHLIAETNKAKPSLLAKVDTKVEEAKAAKKEGENDCDTKEEKKDEAKHHDGTSSSG